MAQAPQVREDPRVTRAVRRRDVWERLNLIHMDVGNPGAKSVADLVAAGHRILEVCLAENKIDDVGARLLAVALRDVPPRNIRPQMHTLDLNINNLGDGGARSLASALEDNTMLRTLTLSKNEIGLIGSRAFAGLLRRNTPLTRLDLSENPISPQGAEELADAFAAGVNTRLKVLSLGACGIGDHGAQVVAEGLLASSLEELNVYGNELGATGAIAVAANISRSTTLLKLDICGNHVGDDGAGAVADLLAADVCILEELIISGNDITAAGAERLAAALATNRSLKLLYLGGNAIGPDGAAHIARCLEVNTALASLGLRHCAVGNEGAIALGQILPTARALTWLGLPRNEIGPEGAQALATGLRQRAGQGAGGDVVAFEGLDLTRNNVADAGATAFAHALLELAAPDMQRVVGRRNRRAAQPHGRGLVKQLQLGRNDIGDVGAQALAEALRVDSRIVDFELHMNLIGEDGARALATALQMNQRMERFCICGNSLNIQGAQDFAQAFQEGGNRHLKYLDMGLCSIGVTGARAIAGILPNYGSLMELDLSSCYLEDGGATAVADVLARTRIEELRLSGNNIGAGGAWYLAEAIPRCVPLRVVDLDANAVLDEGAAWLAVAVRQSQTLAELGLRENGIGQAAIDNLKRASWQNNCLCKVRLDPADSEANIAVLAAARLVAAQQ